MTGFETNNKYEIVNSLGQRVYHAVEGMYKFSNVLLKYFKYCHT